MVNLLYHEGGSVDSILGEIFEENVKLWSVKEALQALSSLYHLHKLSPNEEYLFRSQILSHPNFTRAILDPLSGFNMEVATPVQLAYGFMCLKRLAHNSPMEGNMVEFALGRHLIRNCLPQMDPEALAYICVGMRGTDELNSKVRDVDLRSSLALAPILGRLTKILNSGAQDNQVLTLKDLGHIATVVNSCIRLLNTEAVEDYIAFVDKKLSVLCPEPEKDIAKHISELVKIASLALLERNLIAIRYDSFPRPILHWFVGNSKHLNTLEVLIISNIVQESSDPVMLLYELTSTVRRHYEELKMSPEADPFYKVELLRALFSSNVYPALKENLPSVLLKFVCGETGFLGLHSIHSIFKVIEVTGMQNRHLRDQLLNSAIHASTGRVADLVRLCIRYNNMFYAGEERFIDPKFEATMLPLVHERLEGCVRPTHFAAFFGFLLHTSNEIDSRWVDRFLDLTPQMDNFCLFLIQHGIDRRSYRFPSLQNVSTDTVTHNLLLEVKTTLLARTIVIEQNVPSGMDSLSVNLCLKRSKLEKENKDGIPLSKLNFNSLHLTSSVVKKLCKSLMFDRSKANTSSLEIDPDIFDRLRDYVIAEEDNIFGSVAYLVSLTLAQYNYPVEMYEPYLQCLNRILLRDWHSLGGLKVLRLGKLLTSYKYLTPQLAKQIFSVDFMDKLDDEIQGRDNPIYDKNVRDTLMQLNKSVFLLYPEYGISWFHRDYVQLVDVRRRIMSRASQHLAPEHTGVRGEVLSILSDVFGGARFVRQKVFSPYYDYIDFEVVLERGRDMCPVSIEAPSSVKDFLRDPDCIVLAVLVRGAVNYIPQTFNKMDKEMLTNQGYSVLHVDPKMWRSLQMNEAGMKEKYIMDKVKELEKDN